VVVEVTALVVTANVTLLAPAAIVTLAGVRATEVLLLESVTVAPPVGAAVLNVTVPVDDCTPPTTLVGFTVNDERATGAEAEEDTSKSRTAGLRSFCEIATNFEGEII